MTHDLVVSNGKIKIGGRRITGLRGVLTLVEMKIEKLNEDLRLGL